MSLRLITPAASYPVSLAEAKAHLHEDADDFDSLITTYIAAATDYAERFTGRSLVEQIWEQEQLDGFPANNGDIVLTPLPLIEVLSLTVDGVVADPSSYSVYSSGIIKPVVSWPVGDSVVVRFRAGYIDDASPAVSNVPASIKAAILITVGTLYAHRESVVVGQVASLLPWSAEQLLRKYRIHTSIA